MTVRRALLAAIMIVLPASVARAQRALDHGAWVRARTMNGVVYMGRVAGTAYGVATSESLFVSLDRARRGALAMSRPDTILAVSSAELLQIEQGTDRGYGWVQRWSVVGAAAGAGLGALVGLSTPINDTHSEKVLAIIVTAFGGFIAGQTSAHMSRIRWDPFWRRDPAVSPDPSGS